MHPLPGQLERPRDGDLTAAGILEGNETDREAAHAARDDRALAGQHGEPAQLPEAILGDRALLRGQHAEPERAVPAPARPERPVGGPEGNGRLARPEGREADEEAHRGAHPAGPARAREPDQAGRRPARVAPGGLARATAQGAVELPLRAHPVLRRSRRHRPHVPAVFRLHELPRSLQPAGEAGIVHQSQGADDQVLHD